MTYSQRVCIEKYTAIIDTSLELLQGDFLHYNLSDLTRLQKLVDAGFIVSVFYFPFSTVFAQIFLSANPEFKWVSITDDKKQKLAIRYLNTHVIWYPAALFSNVDKKDLCVRKIYLDLLSQLRKRLVETGDYGRF